MNKDLIEKFNLKAYVKAEKNSSWRIIALRIAFILVSFFIGNLIGQTINHFFYPKIGNYCILVSIALGFVIWRPLTKYLGELEYTLYLKWM